jgi:AcrR family transcriptional regulator
MPRSSTSAAPSAPARGRPRDEKVRDAILESAYVLVRERGYADVTTADIAARAGAGKQTIYRWWPSKFALVLDALDVWMQKLLPPKPPTTLSAFLIELSRGATHVAPILRSLIAEAQHDPELRAVLRARVVAPYRAALRKCLPAHRAADRELIISAVYGAIMYQLLLDEPLDATFIRGVSRMVAKLS